jgi:hypothetical protein
MAKTADFREAAFRSWRRFVKLVTWASPDECYRAGFHAGLRAMRRHLTGK